MFQVDAFADKFFAGNPAAVCLLDEPRPDPWMQAVAAEMNVAETAFVEVRDGSFGLRWFTPVVEVPLCGHATLAAAHVLWSEGVATSPTRFDTASGTLVAKRSATEIELDFPADPPVGDSSPDGGTLAGALGAPARWQGRSRLFDLVEVDHEETVRSLEPDLEQIRRTVAHAVIVTAASAAGSDHHFVSRTFAPALGIDEDPVTGSAHCVLGPYWAERLRLDELIGYQASARGGTVRVALAGERILIAGRAVTFLRGEID